MTTALERRESPVEIVAPIDDDILVENWRRMQRFKQRVLTKDDYVVIAGRLYLKKSAWRKWEFACGVSDEIVSFDRVPTQGKDQGGNFSYRVVVRAFHEKSGRSSVGVAAASRREKKDWAHEEHDIFALAHTRAKNRAIADLVGGGEVSAEEMTSEIQRTPAPAESPVPQVQGPASPASASDLTNEALTVLKWTQSTKLPQLQTILVNEASRKVPIIALLYERLKTAANETCKIGDVTYKISRNDEGTEWLQRWSSQK
jgi:hypothetical protein